MLKTYKFRIYPSNEQIEKLNQHFGHTRFVYNLFLEFSSNAYKNTKTSTNYYMWAKVLTALKKTEKYQWLNDANSQSLQQSIKNLETGFKRFFKKQSKYPKFKKKSLITERPFRAPHHSISNAGLIGGGSYPRPGEVSLAHHGVLFLDELAEFRRDVLELLRQPLEEGRVTIARALISLTYPSDFMLIAALNPCPCGFYTDTGKECSCNAIQIGRYLRKISGPLLDRFDIHIEVPRLHTEEILVNSGGEKSEDIRNRVVRAREIQYERFKGKKLFNNSQMNNKDIYSYCPVEADIKKLLKQAIDRFSFSARAYHRILKLSRTIADLSGGGKILLEHVAEAIQYRSAGLKFWN